MAPFRVFVLGAFCGGVAAFSACSPALGMVDPFVTANWNVSLMEGTFYELAYHDYTQPRELCGCERSVKTVSTETEPATIADLFTLKCPVGSNGKDRIAHLSFEATGTPGVLSGECSYFAPFGTTVCPDYVLDVGTRTPGAPFPWVIEFQCVENTLGGLLFAGVNFYARETSQETLAAMRASATAHGLDDFIDGGFPQGLHLVNHTDCTYPPPR